MVILVAAVAAVGLSLFAGGAFGWELPPGVTRLLGLTPTSRLGALMLGLVLVVLARGLARRRIAAHRVLLIVLGVCAFDALAGHHDFRRAAVVAVGIVAVWTVRAHFLTPPDPRRLRITLMASGGVLLATVAGSSTWMVWRNPYLQHRGGAVHAVEGALGGFVGLSAVVERALPAGSDPANVTLLLGGLTAVVALLVVFSSRPALGPAPARVRRRVAQLVAAAGADTFAPFALRHDKDYAFSPDGRAAVGYRVLFGVAVAGGDPVGHPDALGAAVQAFLEHCAHQGWRPFVIGVRGDLVGLWTRFGMHSFGIGDEVVVDVENFTVDTPRLRNVRQAVKRTRNMGVTTEILREGDLDEPALAELCEVTARCWGGMPERGFSMNLDGLLTGIHPGALLVVCRDDTGTVVAFQRYVLCGDGEALSLDTMCRVPGAPNGVNERMIVEAVQWGGERGVAVASLNFAAFRLLFDAEQRSPLEALGYRTVHLLDRWIKLESLYRFNAKFRPRWIPRSVVLRGWSDLPFILPAALAAEFGGPLDFHRPSAASLQSAAADEARLHHDGAVGPDVLAHRPLSS